MGVNPEAEQLRFMEQPLPLKQLNRLIGADRAFFDGQGLGGQLPHPLLHPLQQCLIQNKAALGMDKKGTAEGIFHTDTLHVLPAHHVIKRLEH